MAQNQKIYRIKQDWQTVLGSRTLADWMNDVAGTLNNINVLKGGETILKKRGIDIRVDAAQAGLGDFEIFLKDGTTLQVTMSTILTDFDSSTDTDWSAKFTVTSGAIAAYDTSDNTTDLYDGDASADPVVAQTYYAIPIIRNGKKVATGGSYQESRMCAGSKGPIVELLKIG